MFSLPPSSLPPSSLYTCVIYSSLFLPGGGRVCQCDATLYLYTAINYVHRSSIRTSLTSAPR